MVAAAATPAEVFGGHAGGGFAGAGHAGNFAGAGHAGNFAAGGHFAGNGGRGWSGNGWNVAAVGTVAAQDGDPVWPSDWA